MQGTAFATGENNPILNPLYGGMNGFAPDHSQYLSAKKYIRQNSFIILLQAPGFMKQMPNPQAWITTLRNMLELHVKSFEGFKWGLKADTATSPVGGDGQVFHEITGMTMETSNPTFAWDELEGQVFFRFLNAWLRYGAMDPQTKTAMVSTIASSTQTDNLPDQYSCSYIVIEPDRLFKKVVQSMLVVNSFPTTTDTMELKRDLTQASEIKTLNIEFTGLCSVNYGNNVLAQRLLDQLNITGANPASRSTFYTGVDADVSAALNGSMTGLTSNIANLEAGNASYIGI